MSGSYGTNGPNGPVVEEAPDDDGSGGDDGSPGMALTTVRTRTFHGVPLPYSTLHGPRTFTPTTSAGFTHDLGGAVMAAIRTCSYSAPVAGPDIYGPTISRQIIGDTTTCLASVDADYHQRRQESGLPGGFAHPRK